MSYYSYPESPKKKAESPLEKVIEELDILGYSILENVLSREGADIFAQALDVVWKKQVDEYGEPNLRTLGEWGQPRALLVYDKVFARLITDDFVMRVLEKTVGEAAILHCMNGSIALPSESYAQARWHRDFEKNFSSDKILSLNAFWLLDDFESDNGATLLVPHTHRLGYIPSDAYLEKHSIVLTAKAGSLLLFDSRLYHRAGCNRTAMPRRALNFQYTRPFIKQQTDFPSMFRGVVDRETSLGRILGMWSVPPKDLKSFRVHPEERSYKRGQG